VQSNKNRERDFTHGKASTFIFAGLAFVFLFILFVIGIVKVVMHFAVPS
jgi:Na+-transporting methylmalonyl-CoA/oxaloacetate decarboxylase gamma subunit